RITELVILPDNDDPGRAHAMDIARSCRDAGFVVKILELPDLPVHGDVSDWLDAGHTRDDLLALADACQPVLATLADPNAPNINAGDQHLAQTADAAWAALERANRPSPAIFFRAGCVVRLETDETGASLLRALDADRLCHHIARVAIWTKHG